MNTEHMAIKTTILRGLVGSTIHGLNVQDGIEDRDEMGICVEPIEHVAGLHPFEQYIYRSAAEREGDHNARRHKSKDSLGSEEEGTAPAQNY